MKKIKYNYHHLRLVLLFLFVYWCCFWIHNLPIYPTIAAICDRNWPVVYTIAIYGRLYTAEWRRRSTFLKCKWPPFFSPRFKFVWWITLFDGINVAYNNCCVIKFALFVIKRNNFIPLIHLSYVSHIDCFVKFISIKRK